jgi:hypothetical protein
MNDMPQNGKYCNAPFRGLGQKYPYWKLIYDISGVGEIMPIYHQIMQFYLHICY